MGIARSTYYSEDPKGSADDTALVEAMHAIKDEFEAYGWRRMQAALRHRGWIVNHKKVKRLMREHALHPPRRRRFVATTDSDHDEPVFPDRSRDCEIDGPNQLWVADLTYIAILGGFVYLAAIMDAWSRRITGYAIGRIGGSMPGSLLPRWQRRSKAATRHPDASTIRIEVRSTPPRPCWGYRPKLMEWTPPPDAPCSANMAWSARWRGAATPTTTR